MAKRGRPKVGEEAARREVVIQAAFEELVTFGYEKTTMLGIAKRAGASKETLYVWFSNKEGLFSALIKHQAETTVEGINAALENAKPRTTLEAFAISLLKLLLSEPSLSLNQVAMSSPELAPVLLQHGRYTAGPIVERYLEQLDQRYGLAIPCPQTAFQTLYGLIIQDWQIRALLGEEPPTSEALSRHAAVAIDQFLRLHSTT